VSVSSLESSGLFHLTAAQGWLELGKHIEANNELEQIAPLNRAHPDVLEVRSKIYRVAKRFEACAEIAEAIRERAPQDHLGYIYAAQTHYWQKDYQKAYDLLRPQREAFPQNWWVHYDMACYACLLGRLDEARTHLDKPFNLDTTKEAKLR